MSTPPPGRPALHGLIDQAPRQWKSDEQREQWLAAFRLVLDYSISVRPPPSDGDIVSGPEFDIEGAS